MEGLEGFSIKARHYKCFGEDEQGFDTIRPLNLIIGRNNSGKSTLLELLKLATSSFKSESEYELRHLYNEPQFFGDAPLTEAELQQVFRPGTRLLGMNVDAWEHGRQHVGKMYKWRLGVSGPQAHVPSSGDVAKEGFFRNPDFEREYSANLSVRRTNRLHGCTYVHLAAERNIVPEVSAEDSNVESDGRGATNLIQKFLNDHGRATEAVEEQVLSELNHILQPDLKITRILCKRLGDEKWEIFLEELGKGIIALSQSGSGLKTLILVLVLIRLVPKDLKKPIDHFVFGFEELENNLHPAILRRLLSFLYQVATTEGCIFALTTHSNVEIDYFSSKPEAQIIHVTHDGMKARAATVLDHRACQSILDDLDVRASDLLQSNGVIWVEGPSDRIYLKRWIELWSDGVLQEGLHFQCVFYGGKLLAHLSGESPLAECDLVKVLLVNRNSAIVIDSDKRDGNAGINPTKTRLVEEFEKRGAFAWVTHGKEIENYLPPSLLEKVFEFECKQLPAFNDVIKRITENTARKRINKPLLATELTPLLTKENCEGILDLNDKMNHLCKIIFKWNSSRQ